MIEWLKSKPGTPRWFDVMGLNIRKVGLILLLLAAAGFGIRAGLHFYSIQKEEHLAHQARQFLDHADNRSAVLSARQVLEMNPNNVEATRVIAEAAEQGQSPAALLWRQRLADIAPKDNENYLAWASTALSMGDYLAADRALSKVDSRQRDSAKYHAIAASIALSVKKYQAAEFHFASAAKLDPKNEIYQLNLASIRLLSSRPEVVKQSRETLQHLSSDPKLGATALRSLWSDAEFHKDHQKALDYARQLDAAPSASFRDHFPYLDALRETSDPKFKSVLAALKVKAAADAASTSDLAGWMNARGMGTETWKWLVSLPLEKQSVQPVPISIAESYLQIRDWQALRKWINPQDWKELNFLRFAIYARASRELELWGDYRGAWRQALNATHNDVVMLGILARLAQKWGLTAEAEEVWWAIARGNSSQLPALDSLFHLYAQTRDARRLLRVCLRIEEVNPEDRIAKNNLAQLSLLLNQDLDHAYKIAEDNYRFKPDNFGFLTTYAFSLHKQGRTKEGLKVLEKLPPAQLRTPAAATYYGILLAAAGEPDKAKPYLDIAEKSGQLFPAEAALTALARQVSQ